MTEPTINEPHPLREIILSLRVTRYQLEIMERLAAAKRQTVSEFIRTAVAEYAAKEGLEDFFGPERGPWAPQMRSDVA